MLFKRVCPNELPKACQRCLPTHLIRFVTASYFANVSIAWGNLEKVPFYLVFTDSQWTTKLNPKYEKTLTIYHLLVGGENDGGIVVKLQ
ncbi:hypothetical protein ACFLUU_00505 [Chloroflexota bacterium]